MRLHDADLVVEKRFSHNHVPLPNHGHIYGDTQMPQAC